MGYGAALVFNLQGVALELPWGLAVQPGLVSHGASTSKLALPLSLSPRLGLTAVTAAMLATVVSGLVSVQRLLKRG